MACSCNSNCSSTSSLPDFFAPRLPPHVTGIRTTARQCVVNASSWPAACILWNAWREAPADSFALALVSLRREGRVRRPTAPSPLLPRHRRRPGSVTTTRLVSHPCLFSYKAATWIVVLARYTSVLLLGGSPGPACGGCGWTDHSLSLSLLQLKQHHLHTLQVADLRKENTNPSAPPLLPLVTLHVHLPWLPPVLVPALFHIDLTLLARPFLPTRPHPLVPRLALSPTCTNERTYIHSSISVSVL